MSETSYFVKWKLDPDVERVLINALAEGNGLVAATDDGSEAVFDEEHPYQQAVYNAIKGTTIRLTAKAAEGWTFKEWKNALTGRLYSTDEAITVEANGSLKLTAVFVDANQPVTTDETFLQWVKADYEKKTGVAVYTDNRIGSLIYVPMYLDLGYNCVIYDLRGHGGNASTFTSYGIREGQDLAVLVKDTRSRYPEISQLILHGESLGAATTLSSLQYKPDVDLAVADCGFSDIENVLREGYRNAHVPVFLVDLADLGSRIRYHYAIKDMRPIDALADNTVPILFIHGEEDGFILPQNSVDNAGATKGYHEVYFIPGAGHAESILTQPEEYAVYVHGFITEVTEEDGSGR